MVTVFVLILLSLPLSEKKQTRSISMVDVKLMCRERYILLQVVGDILHMLRDLYDVHVRCDVMIHECRAKSGLVTNSLICEKSSTAG